MVRRLVTVVLAVAVAYAAGFVADVALNDDCVPADAREGDVIESVNELLPVRSGCRVLTPGGRVRSVERGEAEVFWATFAGALLVAVALLARLARLLRFVFIVGAVVGAGYVIFA